jgi:acyl carrier protein
MPQKPPSSDVRRSPAEIRRRPSGAGLAALPSEPSRPDPEAVAGVLTTFVNASIMARGRPIRADDELEAAGVDSMALLRLLLFVETEFGFWMPDDDLVDDNIGSLRVLARYICRRGAGS